MAEKAKAKNGIKPVRGRQAKKGLVRARTKNLSLWGGQMWVA